MARAPQAARDDSSILLRTVRPLVLGMGMRHSRAGGNPEIRPYRLDSRLRGNDK